MVNKKTTTRRNIYINKCDIFTHFICNKKIVLSDKEYLSCKKFLWKPTAIERSEHIIEILLGYFICDFKSKTLVVCDHITSKIFRYKAKHLLNHNCDINSCLDIVSKHELRSRMSEYHHHNWDRVVAFEMCLSIPPTDNFVLVAKNSPIDY